MTPRERRSVVECRAMHSRCSAARCSRRSRSRRRCRDARGEEHRARFFAHLGRQCKSTHRDGGRCAAIAGDLAPRHREGSAGYDVGSDCTTGTQRAGGDAGRASTRFRRMTLCPRVMPGPRGAGGAWHSATCSPDGRSADLVLRVYLRRRPMSTTCGARAAKANDGPRSVDGERGAWCLPRACSRWTRGDVLQVGIGETCRTRSRPKPVGRADARPRGT